MSRKKRKIWKRDRGRCVYCGVELSWKNKTIDHVIPRSKGGTHRSWNLVISCLPCNQLKADSDPLKKHLEICHMRMRAHQMYIILLRSRYVPNKGHEEI